MDIPLASLSFHASGNASGMNFWAATTSGGGRSTASPSSAADGALSFQQEVGPLTSQATPCSTACATAWRTVSSGQAGMAKVSS